MSRLNSVFAGAAAIAATAAFLPLGALAAPSGSTSQSEATIVGPAQASSEPAFRIVLEDYPVPASQAYKLLPGDPGVVTNGPIPDTPANRIQYGEPLSHAGKASAPTGD